MGDRTPICLLGPTVAQSLIRQGPVGYGIIDRIAYRPTSLHICGTETIRGKVFSREDIFARRNFRVRYFRGKIFSREDIFA